MYVLDIGRTVLILEWRGPFDAEIKPRSFACHCCLLHLWDDVSLQSACSTNARMSPGREGARPESSERDRQVFKGSSADFFKDEDRERDQ